MSRFVSTAQRYTCTSLCKSDGKLMAFDSKIVARAVTELGVFLTLLMLNSIASAASLEVSVLDRSGLPVPDVAVYLQKNDGVTLLAAPGTTAVMDQVDIKFKPNLLVVQSGTSVIFPNSDTVAHHVYSFSHPNHFKLPLYKSDTQPLVNFESAGIVILGCNVHDYMLGYILVVDTPLFALTNGNGISQFDVEIGAVDTVSIWSPRIKDEARLLSKPVTLGEETNTRVVFQLSKSLRLAHDQESDALLWSDY